jgi:hypothetical protein
VGSYENASENEMEMELTMIPKLYQQADLLYHSHVELIVDRRLSQ